MKQKIYSSLYIPILFVILIWCIKLLEIALDQKWFVYGLQPQTLSGLWGVLTAPLLHGSFSHLWSNTFPLLVLGSALFYLYRKIALKVCFIIFLFTGLLVWIFGSSNSYHIGASGLIYGFAFFLFFSGIMRKHKALMATSLLTVFLYGSIVWGVLPGKQGMSWESHLMGAFCGMLLAFYYKDKKMKVEEEDNKTTSLLIFTQGTSTNDFSCTYYFIKNKFKLRDAEEFSVD